jgi:hypothetical protein
MCQQAWDTGNLPIEWRQAKLIAVPKPRVPGAPRDFRGISVLSHIGKIFTSVMLGRLQVIPLLDCQHGFRSRRGTEAPILTQKLVMEAAIAHNEPLHSLYVDIAKAYDSVSRPVLWTLLQQAGVGPLFRRALSALYDDDIVVYWKGVRTLPWASSVGVKQGCNLSPTLFNIALDSALRSALPKMIPYTRATDAGLLDATLLAYADDLVLNAKSSEAANYNGNVLSCHLASLGLTISVSKTRHLRLHQRTTHLERRTQSTLLPFVAHVRATTHAATTPVPDAPSVKPIPKVHPETGNYRVWYVRAESTNMICPHPACNLTFRVVGNARSVEGMRKHWLQHHKLRLFFTPLRPFRDGDQRCSRCGHAYRLSHPHCPQDYVQAYFIPQQISGPPPLTAIPQCVICRQTYHSESYLAQHSCLGPPPTWDYPAPVFLYGTPVPHAPTFKYLGHVLTTTARDDTDFHARLSLTRRLFGAVAPLLNKPAVKLSHRLHFFNTLIRSVLFYAPVWSLTRGMEDLLVGLQNRILRCITGLHFNGTRYPSLCSLLQRTGQPHILAQYSDVQGRMVERIQAREPTAWLALLHSALHPRRRNSIAHRCLESLRTLIRSREGNAEGPGPPLPSGESEAS